MAEILLSGWKDDKPKNPDFTKEKTATADSFRRRSNKQLERKLKDLDTADQNVDCHSSDADSRTSKIKNQRSRTITITKQRRNYHMTQEEFNVVFELQMRKCADILAHKKKEYTGDNIDRLSAFKIAAALQNCDPKAALAGMMSKHVVSLYDMCYSTLLHFDMEQWDEKITDCINYLILLKSSGKGGTGLWITLKQLS